MCWQSGTPRWRLHAISRSIRQFNRSGNIDLNHVMDALQREGSSRELELPQHLQIREPE